jgi:RNA polymerase sigma-70 factor, ECF subfamily
MEPTAAREPMLAAREIARLGECDFDSVVRLYWPGVFRFVLASVRDVDAAQTVAQDCFLRAYQSWGRFRGDCSVQTWLLRIAVNLVRDRMRSRRLQFWKRAEKTAIEVGDAGVWLADRQASPELQLALAEQVRRIWSAAEGLPDRQKTVFLLRFVEDLELLEIAAATGMSEGTVKTHLFRALRAVRERLGGTP